MRVYVLIGFFQGVVSEVKGFIDPSQANIEFERLREKYGIAPGYEAESENAVQLHDIDVDARPASVSARRLVW